MKKWSNQTYKHDTQPNKLNREFSIKGEEHLKPYTIAETKRNFRLLIWRREKLKMNRRGLRRFFVSLYIHTTNHHHTTIFDQAAQPTPTALKNRNYVLSRDKKTLL